jgi:hypothetical protein
MLPPESPKQEEDAAFKKSTRLLTPAQRVEGQKKKQGDGGGMGEHPKSGDSENATHNSFIFGCERRSVSTAPAASFTDYADLGYNTEAVSAK